MQITIENVVPSVDYTTPNRPVEMLDIFYRTENGYKSHMKIPKSEFDLDKIGAKIKEHCGNICAGIGKTITV